MFFFKTFLHLQNKALYIRAIIGIVADIQISV